MGKGDEGVFPPLMQRLIKKPLRWLGAALLGGILAAVGFNVWIVQRSRDRITSDPGAVPRAPVALVLGTSRSLPSGRINAHWRMRMDAAAALWKAGRVTRLLVSGDNRRADYNEPRDMREGLMARGVPSGAILLDYAGLRTLLSVNRAREVFGFSACVIVSDDFHLPRALWLAERRGMQVSGFQGPGLSWGQSGKTRVREWLARVNAALEEWVWGPGEATLGWVRGLSGRGGDGRTPGTQATGAPGPTR